MTEYASQLEDPAAEASTRLRQIGQSGYAEPAIGEDRQRFLASRATAKPDIQHGIYPFRDIRLDRADVEWLLATRQEDATRGGEAAQPRGLDLRGADLRHADLSGLPLSGLLAGLAYTEWLAARDDQREWAAAHLERAILGGAHLESAILGGAHLERADLTGAHLEGAELIASRLERARLHQVYLEGARASGVHLEQADLSESHLEGADMEGANFCQTDLTHASMEGTILRTAGFEGARLFWARLGGKDMPAADLERIRHWKPEFAQRLRPSDLSEAHFNVLSDLIGIELGDATYGWVELVDVRWGDAILSVVDWSRVLVLGDEQKALSERRPNGEPKPRDVRLAEMETATRANRQLAFALQAQGLSEQGARFGYRAALLHRKVLWWQFAWEMEGPQQSAPGHGRLRSRAQKLVAYLSSLFLDAVSGYGHRPLRVLRMYVAIVIIFAVAHYEVGAHSPNPADHLTWEDAFVLSIQNLHGRVWQFRSQDPQVKVASIEAIVGVFTEGTIVAVIAQRILGHR